jgi:UPF0716 family protein affecting phage T7 exclusion
MDLFLLIIRIIAFAVTLYLLLEFIVVCRVSTALGIIITLGATAIVVLGFILLKRYDVITCQTCKQHMPKKLFNLPIPN